MATKQQVLGKIADLLNDINSQFDDLENDTVPGDSLKGDLFEATVNYFAANVAVYNKLKKAEIAVADEAEQGAGAELDNVAGQGDLAEQDDIVERADDVTELDGEAPAVDAGNEAPEEIVFTPGIDETEADETLADDVESGADDNGADEDTDEEASDIVEVYEETDGSTAVDEAESDSADNKAGIEADGDGVIDIDETVTDDVGE